MFELRNHRYVRGIMILWPGGKIDHLPQADEHQDTLICLSVMVWLKKTILNFRVYFIPLVKCSHGFLTLRVTACYLSASSITFYLTILISSIMHRYKSYHAAVPNDDDNDPFGRGNSESESSLRFWWVISIQLLSWKDDILAYTLYQVGGYLHQDKLCRHLGINRLCING